MQHSPQYLNARDMLDGGGAGQAGTSFQGGGILSQFSNQMLAEQEYQRRWAQRQQQELARQWSLFGSNRHARDVGGQGPTSRPFGPQMQRPGLFDYSGLADMFDGGGAGQSGDSFQGGGLLSSLANTVGGNRK